MAVTRPPGQADPSAMQETSEMFNDHLKGHGNEADYLGFLQKSVPHESLTLPFEPFRIWLLIGEDICNRKTTLRLPKSGSRRLPDSASRSVI
jgi:hypothetical protein